VSLHKRSEMRTGKSQDRGTPRLQDRRDWLRLALAGGALMPLMLRSALAAQTGKSGMVKLQGAVSVAGKPATEGSILRPGDSVVTAAGASAVFVLGEDAFLLREKSELRTSGQGTLLNALRLTTGKLLSVFGKGRRNITTPTVAIGIRGTGIYVEAQVERTYVCTCYGVVDLQAINMPEARETIRARHHDAPRYIYSHGEMPIKMIEVAPVINHSDAELTMLEALLGRKPPFEGYPAQMGEYRY